MTITQSEIFWCRMKHVYRQNTAWRVLTLENHLSKLVTSLRASYSDLMFHHVPFHLHVLTCNEIRSLPKDTPLQSASNLVLSLKTLSLISTANADLSIFLCQPLFYSSVVWAFQIGPFTEAYLWVPKVSLPISALWKESVLLEFRWFIGMWCFSFFGGVFMEVWAWRPLTKVACSESIDMMVLVLT